MRINYTASILFPFVGLIFGKHSTESPHSLSLPSIFALFCGYHILPALSSNFHIKQSSQHQTICRNTFEWTNFKCGTLYDYYFQDILQMFIVFSGERLWSAKNIMVALVRFLSHHILKAKSVFNQFDGWSLHMEIPPYKMESSLNPILLPHKKYDFHFPVDF